MDNFDKICLWVMLVFILWNLVEIKQLLGG